MNRKSLKDKIIFYILTVTGMRLEGLCNILIKNIDLNNRIIKTKEKVTENNNAGEVFYVFPSFMINPLKIYINQQKLSSEDYLIDIGKNSIRKRMDAWAKRSENLELITGIKASPHALRHCLNLKWIDNEVPDAIRCGLLNQTPDKKDANSVHYSKIVCDVEERIKYYDKYFPYYHFFASFEFV